MPQVYVMYFFKNMFLQVRMLSAVWLCDVINVVAVQCMFAKPLFWMCLIIWVMNSIWMLGIALNLLDYQD